MFLDDFFQSSSLTFYEIVVLIQLSWKLPFFELCFDGGEVFLREVFESNIEVVSV